MASLVYEDAKEALQGFLNIKTATHEGIKEFLKKLYQQVARLKECKSQPLEGLTIDQINALEVEYNKLIQENLDVLTAGPPDIDVSLLSFKKDTSGPNFLGQGSFGKVFQGSLGGTKVAIKIPNTKVTKLDDFISEVRIMRRVFNPNVVMLIGASINSEEVVIVSELMKTDLEKYLLSPDYAKETMSKRVKIAKDIAIGLNWIHGLGIIHRDLKLGNILLDEHHTAKIADFGFSQIKKKTEDYFTDKGKPKGNILYMAPEVMRLENFNYKADVYSYGIILWEIITGSLWDPPAEFGTPESYKRFICDLGKRPPITSNIPAKLSYVMQQCWNTLPNDRVELRQVISVLNEFLVDEKVEDPESREFWKKYFVNNQTADYDEQTDAKYFMKLVRRNLGSTNEELVGLKALLTWNWNDSHPKSHRSKVITIDKFNTITKMFGPFFLVKNKGVLPEMLTWVTKKWFHGTIDYTLAHTRLESRKSGFFLIRLSDRKAGHPFTISFVNAKGKIDDIRVLLERDPDRHGHFRYGTKRNEKDPFKYFTTINDVIKKSNFNFTDPCPREKVPENPY